MKQQNMLIAFFQELLQRFFTKSPKFFRIWQWITAIGASITGIPEAASQLGINIPSLISHPLGKFMAAVSTGMFIMSALTTQSKIVGTDATTGATLKITNGTDLPFTAANENKTS